MGDGRCLTPTRGKTYNQPMAGRCAGFDSPAGYSVGRILWLEKRSMAVLEAIKGLTPGQSFPLERQCAVLGRHPDCDIVLDVGAISRQHARILKHGDGFFVEDLHSRNGTFLNEQIVRGQQKLAENDRLRICNLVFVFRQGTGQAAGACRRKSRATPAR